jgi:hypothetical protein
VLNFLGLDIQADASKSKKEAPKDKHSRIVQIVSRQYFFSPRHSFINTPVHPCCQALFLTPSKIFVDNKTNGWYFNKNFEKRKPFQTLKEEMRHNWWWCGTALGVCPPI